MAASRHCVNEEELNLVFKRLGERGKEAELVKEHENFLSYLLAKLAECSTKFTEKKLAVRPYGSAAEDLKYLSLDDYGDMDIMVFPTLDSLMIPQNMFEYLPENPLHVRIKAGDHPVLQSCLVEGTEYLATSAFKNFHPAIYGSKSSEWFDYLKDGLRIGSSSLQWKNKKSGPAFTIDCKQWFGTTLEQLQNMTESKKGCSLEVADWEGLVSAIFTANGVEYTREHASAFDELLSHMGKLQASLFDSGPDGYVHGLPALSEQFLTSDSMKSYIARVRATENQSQNESGSQTEGISHDESSVTQQKCDKGGSSSEIANIAQQYQSDAQTPENKDSESTSFHAVDNTRTPDDLGTEKRNESEGARVLDATENNSKQHGGEVQEESRSAWMNSGEREELTSEDGTVGDRSKHEEKSGERGKFHRKRWMDHLTRTESGNEEHGNEEKDSIKQMRGIDLVPALKCRGWPKASQDWFEKERKWPSDEMVTRIIDEGYHLVVKPPKYSKDPDCDFRISFSHAEYLFSQEMNDMQRVCYRSLKKVYRAYLSSPEGLVSFHLKNLFLQTIEETGAEMWTESKRAECMMKLLGNLLKALKDKDLRHFFVRSYNLFGVDYIDKPENLAALAEMVEKIMENPMEFTEALIQPNGKDTKQVEKNESQQNGERAVPGGAAELGGHTDNQGNKEVMTDAVLDIPQQSVNLLPNYRYHDMQDMYLQVGKELVEKALNGDEIHDPFERSLVEDLKKMIMSHSFQAKSFRELFECSWSNAYYRICLSTELEMRRRVLDAIHGDVELWKYCLSQEDLASGNEIALANRMLDPSNQDHFDLSNVLPAGGITQYLRMFFHGLDHRPPQPARVQTTQAVDDIALD
ncbi:uncharacterized protein LOC111321209 [Stylophora pistillata]|uniref:uncharacterized protein LOC111321209 n=1 Tax=Stylophora pistillata TaxID=50429 RepID=UPI000C057750|nr:uncharacterized protein LOC111321209 [Stylophora pistillata]